MTFDDALKARVEALQARTVESAEKLRDLLEKHAILDAVLEATPVAFALKDEDSVYRYANSAFCGLIGKTPEQIVGKTDYDLFPHADAAEYIVGDRAVLGGGRQQKEEWEVTGPDGPGWVKVSKTAVRDRRGLASGVLCSVTDIRDLKRMEKRLVESERLMREAQSIAHLGHWKYLSGNGRLYGSKEFFSIFGAGRCGADAQAVAGVIHPKDRGRILEAVHRVLKGDSIGQFDHRLLLADGVEKVVCTKARPLVDERGRVIGLIGTVLDISEKAMFEVRLRRVNRIEAIETMVGGIAHEFNNILAIVNGNAELAVEDLSEGHWVREYLAEIQRAGLRGKTLIRHLLGPFSPIPLLMKPVDICSIVKDTVNYMASAIPARVTVEVNGPTSGHAVMGGRSEIRQVLINLCRNAVQAMEEKGGVLEITIELVRTDLAELFFDRELPPGDYVRLQVADTGQGIPEEDVERVFDPFFTTRDVGKGSGMGLYISLGIMKMHSGGIRLGSRPGGGTVVECLFPSNGEMPAAAPYADAARKPHSG